MVRTEEDRKTEIVERVKYYLDLTHIMTYNTPVGCYADFKTKDGRLFYVPWEVVLKIHDLIR